MPTWQKSMCATTVLQMKKHRDTCKISLYAGVLA
jgi:hypothetical protein